MKKQPTINLTVKVLDFTIKGVQIQHGSLPAKWVSRKMLKKVPKKLAKGQELTITLQVSLAAKLGLLRDEPATD